MSGFYNVAREKRIQIFEDTRRHYETDNVLRKAVAESIRAQFYTGERNGLDEIPLFPQEKN